MEITDNYFLTINKHKTFDDLSREERINSLKDKYLEYINEHSEQARAPHTNGPRDVSRCGALSSSSKDAALQGGVIVVLRPLFAAALVVHRRYFNVVPRLFLAVHRPLLAAPLVVRCMYMAVVPGPMPAAVASRCCRRRLRQLICACGVLVPRSMPAAVASRCCERRFQQLACV